MKLFNKVSSSLSTLNSMCKEKPYSYDFVTDIWDAFLLISMVVCFILILVL